MPRYQRRPVTVPTVSGLPLRAFVSALESPLGPPLIARLTHDSGIDDFRRAPVGSAAIGRPRYDLPATSGASPATFNTLAEQCLALSPPKTNAPTVATLARGYRAGVFDPVQVATLVLEAMQRFADGEPRMGMFIASRKADVLAQAEAARARFKAGNPLGPLDGVPVAIKDELDMTPFPTTLGTSFKGRSPAVDDATVVARLRGAGAVLVGKASMQEIGINPVGLNPTYGPARNPYDPTRLTGGSSSGPGGVVASGLCPIAIGADAGGSIRIPASLCGVVGLKATYGRVSGHGVGPLSWELGHAGPLGATVDDVAIAYACIAGEDVRDPQTLGQPAPSLEGLGEVDLTGLRLGIPPAHFEDAQPEVVARCRDAVRALVDRGATVVEVPDPELNLVLWTHTIIVLSEMASALMADIREDVTRFGLDSRTNLAIAQTLRATDLVHALRHRTRLIEEQRQLMQHVDLIVTPSTGCTAPPVPERALPDGESNLKLVDELMRFIRVANLTGFPALSVPVGQDSAGLPIGLQLQGRPWEEPLLLRVARVVESVTQLQPPRVLARIVPG